MDICEFLAIDKLHEESNKRAREVNKKDTIFQKNQNIIINETERVEWVARNARHIMDDLEEQFKRSTKLNSLDITFIFLATALQCARQYIFSNEKFRFIEASEGDNAVKKVFETARVPKKWQDILLAPVPYDAVAREYRDLESTGISAYTHRYRTLGHDPILGWVFGSLNILTDSLTKTNFMSYRVKGGKIQNNETLLPSTLFNEGIEQCQADNLNLPVAVMRQAVHFGTDYFTKHGLPVPFVATLNDSLAKDLTTRFNIDAYSITRGMGLSVLINMLVAIIHKLFYKPNEMNPSLYEVKTRKIILYSNVLASGSNVIYCAISKDLRKFDLGGLLVTLYRLFGDIKFIRQIKQEFIVSGLLEQIRGQELSLAEV